MTDTKKKFEDQIWNGKNFFQIDIGFCKNQTIVDVTNIMVDKINFLLTEVKRLKEQSQQ